MLKNAYDGLCFQLDRLYAEFPQALNRRRPPHNRATPWTKETALGIANEVLVKPLAKHAIVLEECLAVLFNPAVCPCKIRRLYTQIQALARSPIPGPPPASDPLGRGNAVQYVYNIIQSDKDQLRRHVRDEIGDPSVPCSTCHHAEHEASASASLAL